MRRPIVEEGPAFSFDVTAQVAGLTLAGTITKVPEGIYLIVGDRPFRLPLSAKEAKAVRIPPEPALFVSEPVEVGREEIEGFRPYTCGAGWQPTPSSTTSPSS